MDNVLPKNVNVDFALVDVERVEIQCLEGMINIMQRSPNMVIVV